MKRRRRVWVWFALVVTACALVAFFTLAVPRAVESAQRTACIGNLRQISAAKNQYAFDFGGTEDFLLTPANVATYIRELNSCRCPAAKGTNTTFKNSYSINCLTSYPTCKIGHDKLYHRLDWCGPE